MHSVGMLYEGHLHIVQCTSALFRPISLQLNWCYTGNKCMHIMQSNN